MYLLATIYDARGRREGFRKVQDYEVKEYAGTGVSLVPAPFAEGFYYYPMDLMLGILTRLGDDFFENDFEVEEVCDAYARYKPGLTIPTALEMKTEG